MDALDVAKHVSPSGPAGGVTGDAGSTSRVREAAADDSGRPATPAPPPSAPGPAHTATGATAAVEGLNASTSGTAVPGGASGGNQGPAGSGSQSGGGEGGLDCAAGGGEGEGVGEGEADVEEAKAAARAARKARNQAAYEARRLFNNTKRREKAKATKQAKAAALKAQRDAELAAMSPQQQEEVRAALTAARRDKERHAAEQAERVKRALAGEGNPLRVAVDCSFSPHRPPKEMRSLCKQLENCSALNMHAASPSLLTLTSWSPQLQAVAGPMGGDSWRSVKTERGAVEAFGADKVVVLSPDATEPLAAVDRGRVYVIGGIVDRTHIKGLTLQYAESRSVEARRLPIPEHAEQLGLVKGTRKNPILNIDDVFKALMVYDETGDWVKALDAAIPMRKRRPQTMGFVRSGSEASSLHQHGQQQQPQQQGTAGEQEQLEEEGKAELEEEGEGGVEEELEQGSDGQQGRGQGGAVGQQRGVEGGVRQQGVPAEATGTWGQQGEAGPQGEGETQAAGVDAARGGVIEAGAGAGQEGTEALQAPAGASGKAGEAQRDKGNKGRGSRGREKGCVIS